MRGKIPAVAGPRVAIHLVFKPLCGERTLLGSSILSSIQENEYLRRPALSIRSVGLYAKAPHAREMAVPREQSMSMPKADRRDEQVRSPQRISPSDEFGFDSTGDLAGFPIELEPLQARKEFLGSSE